MQSLWMIVAALLFSLMGVAVKLASHHYGTWEIVAYRGLIGVVCMAGLIAAQARRDGTTMIERLRTRRLGMHLRRGISGTISLTLWFFAIAGLPLATAMTINYASPLFIGAWIAFVASRAGERIETRMTLALLSGFVGVVLLLHPSFAGDQWIYAIVGITSAMLTAVAYLSVKALGQAGEPDARIVFWFSAMNAAAGLAGATLFGFHGHDRDGAVLLLAVGVTATLAQLAMTRAYASGGTLLTANLGYTGIVFSTVWGLLVFGDRIDVVSSVGMAIVVASGVGATWMTARRARHDPDEAVAPPMSYKGLTDASADQR